MRGETEEGVGRVVEEGYTAHDKNVSLVPPTPDGKTPGGEDGSSIAPPATTGEKESGVERKFKVLLGANSTISLAKLRTLSWSGCPPLYRGESWRLLLSYSPVNRTRRSAVLDRKRREYWKSISQVGLGEGSSTDPPPTLTKFEQQLLRQILVDLPRTSPTIPLFQSSPVQVMLKRVLYLWAVRNPACSYVQGINDLATPFVWVFLEEWVLTHLGSGVSMKSLDVEDCVPAETMREVESDTYWCLTSLLSGIQDHYTPNQPGLQRQINKLAGIVKRTDAKLHGHLEDNGVQYIQFAFKWCNCLLVREFSPSTLCRVWDTHLSEERGFSEFHVYTCAALLSKFSEDIRGVEDFGELFTFLQQGLPTDGWKDEDVSMLESQAFVLKSLFEGSEAHLEG